jgi:hypothetical protein
VNPCSRELSPLDLTYECGVESAKVFLFPFLFCISDMKKVLVISSFQGWNEIHIPVNVL